MTERRRALGPEGSPTRVVSGGFPFNAEQNSPIVDFDVLVYIQGGSEVIRAMHPGTAISLNDDPPDPSRVTVTLRRGTRDKRERVDGR